ncbi:MAG: hypothetical protein PHX27_00645 [Candidatus ainarchaeum sp.]|nr:hypothetical protein [Candidatus ainarchaeum sp.]
MYDKDIDFGENVNNSSFGFNSQKRKIIFLGISALIILVILAVILLISSNFLSNDLNNFDIGQGENYLRNDINYLDLNQNNLVVPNINKPYCENVTDVTVLVRFAVFADANILTSKISPLNERSRFILIMDNKKIEEVIENPFRSEDNLDEVINLLESKNISNVLIRFPKPDLQTKLKENNMDCYFSNEPINILLLGNMPNSPIK